MMINHRWLIATVIAFLSLVSTVPSCGDDDDSADPLTTATELADAWIQGWSESDPDGVASVFTEDGVYVYEFQTYQGRDEIAGFVEERGSDIENGLRVGDVSETDDGTYVWVAEWDAHGERYTGTLATELDGDLASRIVWVEDPMPVG